MADEQWRLSRRGLLTSFAAAPAVVVPAALTVMAAPNGANAAEIDRTVAQTQAALKAAKGTALVLLGTGAGPVPENARHMTSHVMLHNGNAYILDCGLGVTRQFARTGIPWNALKGIFITHLHPDHSIELAPLLVVGWVRGMQQSVRVYGPPPVKQMTEDYLRASKPIIDFWAEDFHRPPLTAIEVHDQPEAGPVMQDEIVKVSSVLVQHPPVKPAFGYRFDFPDRSIAFSGDTVALDTVVQMAKGADVLVHEAIDLPAMETTIREQIAHGAPGNLATIMDHMRADHAPTEEVGRLAAAAGVKTLVLSHLQPGVSDARFRAAAAKHFKGRIVVGHDLMVI